VFRRCDVLRGKEVPVSGRAVLTASISDRPNDAPVVSGREPVLIAFFGTEAGRRALSRSGRSDRVEVLQATARDSVVWIRLRDTSEAVALDQVSVRAIFDLGGRIVTVTAASYAEAPLPMSRLSALAEEFVTRIRARNRGATAPAL
jgi:hypothetical protein